MNNWIYQDVSYNNINYLVCLQKRLDELIKLTKESGYNTYSTRDIIYDFLEYIEDESVFHRQKKIANMCLKRLFKLMEKYNDEIFLL